MKRQGIALVAGAALVASLIGGSYSITHADELACTAGNPAAEVVQRAETAGPATAEVVCTAGDEAAESPVRKTAEGLCTAGDEAAEVVLRAEGSESATETVDCFPASGETQIEKRTEVSDGEQLDGNIVPRP